jgi:biotin transport system substrate-specific component
VTATMSPPRLLADVFVRSGTKTPTWVKDVLLVVGFACFTALLAQVRISLSFTPVPITGQTLAVLLAGTTLGWRRGAASQLLYWVVGIVMPVAWYAGDSSGSSITEGWRIATGATAGYLAGFVLAAALVGCLAERGQDRAELTALPAMLAGSAAIYVCGVAWLAYDLDVPVATGDPSALALGFTPFVIGDVIKVALAGLIAPLAWRLVGRSR